MRLKILLPAAIVLGLFAVQPPLTNAALAQTSTMTQPAAKKPAAKKATAKKATAKKPAAKKATAKKAAAKKPAKPKMS